MVDRIRIGQQGYAVVIADGGLLIAHGDPDQKARIASGENLGNNELVAAIAARPRPAIPTTRTAPWMVVKTCFTSMSTCRASSSSQWQRL